VAKRSRIRRGSSAPLRMLECKCGQPPTLPTISGGLRNGTRRLLSESSRSPPAAFGVDPGLAYAVGRQGLKIKVAAGRQARRRRPAPGPEGETPTIAGLPQQQPGVATDLISPPRTHDIYSIEDRGPR